MAKGISFKNFNDIIICFQKDVFNFILKYNLHKFQEISKILVKNTKEESGKCRTIILIDGDQVYTSDAYEWKHPDSSQTEFKVYAGHSWYNREVKALVKNIIITSYE